MSGTVTFSNYPAANRVPGVYFEVDASQANTSTINQRSLLIGQKNSSGNAVAGIPVMYTGQRDCEAACGAGSMLANMAAKYRRKDVFGELWLLPLADNVAGTAGVQTLTVSGPATASGTLSLYVADQLVSVGVTAGDTANAIAANIVSAVNKIATLPCTASASGAVVSLTADHSGVAAGDIDVRLNYLGNRGSEYTPAGVSVVVATATEASGDPDATTGIAAGLSALSPDMNFDFICCPYTGTAALTAVESFLNDVSGRWSYVSEMFGMAWSAFRGTLAQAQTFGTTNNSQHVTVLPYSNSPTPAYLVAADYMATAANSLRADPAMPLQNIMLSFSAPPMADRWDMSERNTLLYSGLSTFRVSDANEVILERAVTTWQTNPAGAPDSSYLDVETLYTLQYLIRDLRTDLQSKFARRKLVADGTRVPFGTNFVTAQTIKNEVIANYRRNALAGYCQDPDTFARTVVAENAGNGRVSILWPGNLANQLRVISVLAQFIKT